MTFLRTLSSFLLAAVLATTYGCMTDGDDSDRTLSGELGSGDGDGGDGEGDDGGGDGEGDDGGGGRR